MQGDTIIYHSLLRNFYGGYVPIYAEIYIYIHYIYIYTYGIHKQKHKQKLQTISAVGLQYGNLSPE